MARLGGSCDKVRTPVKKLKLKTIIRMQTIFGHLRTLLVLAALLPSAAMAEDTQVQVRVDYTSYRVKPQPRPTRSHVDYAFTLKEDGTIQQEAKSSGPHGTRTKSETTLGKRFRVVDEKTIQRKIESTDHIQTITITVAGNRCRAAMTNELKPGFTEWESKSTELGVKAYYRDWKMISSKCTIR
jgi:hypothetical protein